VILAFIQNGLCARQPSLPKVDLPTDDGQFAVLDVRIVVEIKSTLRITESEELEELTIEGRAPHSIKVTRYAVQTPSRSYVVVPRSQKSTEKVKALNGKSVTMRAVVKEGRLLNTGRPDPHAPDGSFFLQVERLNAVKTKDRQ